MACIGLCMLLMQHSRWTSHHLFFSCPFVVKIWSWLSRTINVNLKLSSYEDLWSFENTSRSHKCDLAITTSFIFFINGIWMARNSIQFNKKMMLFSPMGALILSQVMLTSSSKELWMILLSSRLLISHYIHLEHLSLTSLFGPLLQGI